MGQPYTKTKTVHTVSEDKYDENPSDNRNGWIGEYGRYIKQ